MNRDTEDGNANSQPTSALVASNIKVKSIRTESLTPFNFRVAEYPDGRKIVQGAYQWRDGFCSGHTWKNLPLVQVDVAGQEIA